MNNLRISRFSGLLLFAVLVAPLAASAGVSEEVKKVKAWTGNFSVHFNLGEDSQPIAGYKGTKNVEGTFVLAEYDEEGPYLTWSGTSRATITMTDGKTSEITDGEAWLSMDLDTGTYAVKFGDFPFSASWKNGMSAGAVELMSDDRPIPGDFGYVTYNGAIETNAGKRPFGFSFKPAK